MKRICPSIQELLAFDATARYESMTMAAEVLCLTVSAVSKQLTGLENFIGKPLLKKKRRGIQLTPLGRDYWAKISPALRIMESATIAAAANDSGVGILTLASTPTFLTKWLIPRLSDFRRRHPGVTFNFNRHLRLDEALAFDVDAAIRYGSGNWPGIVSDYIAGRDFVCIYSPELLKKGKRIQSPNDLLAYPLLHHEEAPYAWNTWGAQHGLDQVRFFSGPRFVQYSALIQAVLSGFGIGLVPRILVEEELHDGRAAVFGNSVDVDQGHYLCYHANRLERPVFAAFHSWLLLLGKNARPAKGTG
ncbi:MAG: LysR family transcriptional regulator, partial [Candidatus Accumulibacter sp.]|nr:LysR family transcriptional regulator [Accumulibacter sp.]